MVNMCVACMYFFSLTYSSSFLSPPPTHYHPTLFWSSYKRRELSHYLSHTPSLTDAYQNISNWFCLCAFCLMRPVAQALKASLLTIEKNRGRKRAIQMRKNSIPSSSSSSSPLCSSTNHTFFLIQRMLRGLGSRCKILWKISNEPLQQSSSHIHAVLSVADGSICQSSDFHSYYVHTYRIFEKKPQSMPFTVLIQYSPHLEGVWLCMIKNLISVKCAQKMITTNPPKP